MTALHENPKAHLAAGAVAGQSLIHCSNMIHGSRSILVIEADQIERGTAATADPIVGAVDGEVADIHIVGFGD